MLLEPFVFTCTLISILRSRRTDKTSSTGSGHFRYPASASSLKNACTHAVFRLVVELALAADPFSSFFSSIS